MCRGWALLTTLALFGCVDPVDGTAAPILDGWAATDGSRSATVAVLVDGELACSGTLIEPRRVVTAAHCVAYQDWEDGRVVDVEAARVEVVAGPLDLAVIPPESRHRVARVHRLAEFTSNLLIAIEDPIPLGRLDDLALLELADAVTQLDPVPVLPAEWLDEVLQPGASVVIAGYGVSDDDGSFGVLRWGTTRVVARSDHEVQLSATESRACYGDSGGPGYARVEDAWYLFGATSRGLFESSAWCDADMVSTLVPAYGEWLAAPSVGCAVSRSSAPGGPWIVVLAGLLAAALRRR